MKNTKDLEFVTERNNITDTREPTMESSNDDIVFVSNPPHHKYTKTEYCDTESIISLINMLKFEIKEENKQIFFDELERTLKRNCENEYETCYIKADIINFFMKHISPQGKISA